MKFDNFKPYLYKLVTLLSVVILALCFQNCGEDFNSAQSVNLKECVDDACSEQINPEFASCTFNAIEILHGESITAHLSSTSLDCSDTEERLCEDGALSGSYNYASCSTEREAKKSCLFNGRTIADSEKVTAYLNSSVASDKSCIKEERTCNDGSLSGSHEYSNCKVDAPESCLFDGKTIAHSSFVKAYEKSSVLSPAKCSSQNRVCDNGALKGSYKFASCTVDTPKSCSFNGKTIPDGDGVYAFVKSRVAFGQSCYAGDNRLYRKCDNGVLSRDTARFASCNVNKPKSCLFNGKTVAHNSSVKAYTHSSQKYNVTNACKAYTRTCNNGKLSGNANQKYSSCKKIGQPSCKAGAYTIPHGYELVYNTSYIDPNHNGAFAATQIKDRYSKIPKAHRSKKATCTHYKVYCRIGKTYKTSYSYSGNNTSTASKCGNPAMYKPVKWTSSPYGNTPYIHSSSHILHNKKVPYWFGNK